MPEEHHHPHSLDGPFLSSLVIGLGAAVGANLRHIISNWNGLEVGAGVPWGTLAANVSGSFLLGLFLGLAQRFHLSQRWRLLIGTGLLGGYTTYSMFTHEVVQHAVDRGHGSGALYLALTIVTSLAAAWLGLRLTSQRGSS